MYLKKKKTDSNWKYQHSIVIYLNTTNELGGKYNFVIKWVEICMSMHVYYYVFYF